ncbi:hypothetical protein SAY87_013909 [Trapa incisa]|uniref:IMS import disulfide relay-system CHCH-CHCH-like Cx9C domain-containing protein n=1 Tax=Trapa incisa TaxID=236973 RepID=A0AAN7KCQ5_9MYRT|nr:hypothetical protein SAY87_013909 [Trapa incisa]
MGRKAGGIYINPKKFGSLSKPCMKEMVSFLNCLALNRNDDGKCVRQKDLLNACMDAQICSSLCSATLHAVTQQPNRMGEYQLSPAEA